MKKRSGKTRGKYEEVDRKMHCTERLGHQRSSSSLHVSSSIQLAFIRYVLYLFPGPFIMGQVQRSMSSQIWGAKSFVDAMRGLIYDMHISSTVTLST